MRNQGEHQFCPVNAPRFDRKLNGMIFRSNHNSTISGLAYAFCGNLHTQTRHPRDDQRTAAQEDCQALVIEQSQPH